MSLTTVAVDPQQRVVELGCCGDTGRPAAQEGAALLALCRVAGCSPSDAPPQTVPQDGQDCQGLGSYEGGGYLGIPAWYQDHNVCVCMSRNIRRMKPV